MSELTKIVGIGLMGGMLALTVKSEKPEFAVLISLITAAVISMGVFSYVGTVIDELRLLVEECGIEIKYLEICIKAMGFAYISQFGAEILRDSGENAIASKIEAAGKVANLFLTMPVMTAFLRFCVKVVGSI